MKKIRFIYNPVSGNGIFKNNIDAIIEKFQKSGYLIVPHRLSGKNDAKNAFIDIDNSYSSIIAAGGDGTVHDIVNEICNFNLDLPLGIFPSGTSNDFATFLGLSRNIDENIEKIIKGRFDYVDIGKVNDKYFINVIAGGVLPSIAHKAKKDLKNTFGMFAYYMKAVEELRNIKPFEVIITFDKKIIKENILMFLVLNSSTAGGFNIAPHAKVDDGILDICLIKNCMMHDFASLFVKLLKGEHINDDKLIYFKAKNIAIESYNRVETDVDGEKGYDLPINIEVLSKRIKVFK